MEAWIFRIVAFASRLSTYLVLFGKASRVKGGQGQQLLLQTHYFFINFLNKWIGIHVRYLSYDTGISQDFSLYC